MVQVKSLVKNDNLWPFCTTLQQFKVNGNLGNTMDYLGQFTYSTHLMQTITWHTQVVYLSVVLRGTTIYLINLASS